MKYFVDYLPITTGNDLRFYTDGKDYCADLFAELRAAKRFVLLTGLHFMADFGLVRTNAASRRASGLANVLAEISKNNVAVYLLVNQFWTDESEVSGKVAPLRKQIMKAGELYGYLPETYRLFQALKAYKNVYCRTEIHVNSDIFATHHQKTVVIDDKVAFLGGIDLTYLDGDRWDTHEHKRQHRAVDRTQKFWHDVHLRTRGPAVEYVRDNFIQRWKHGYLHTLRRFSKEGTIHTFYDRNRPALPKFSKGSPTRHVYPTGTESPDVPTVQIVRSMPNTDHWFSEKPTWNRGSDDWERSCKEAYLIGIRAAEKYIYLENQWVADEGIWEALRVAAKRNRKNPDFRIVVMVPYEGLFAAGLGSNQELFIGSEMEDVMQASRDRGTFGMYSVVHPNGSRQGQIYIHSKVLIVDDKWALIGSANAGGISLEGVRSGKDEPDTELSAIILDRKLASGLRASLWQEHLGRKVAKTYSPRDADQFRRLAGKIGHRRRLRFFPGYDHIKRGVNRPRPSGLKLKQFYKHSRIIPSFDHRLRFNLPVALMNASFKVVVTPDPPAGYRSWYRWICLFGTSADGSNQGATRLKLRSLVYDKDEVFEYSDQDSVYIGQETASYIDQRVRDTVRGKILCRVQFVPFEESPDPHRDGAFPSLLLDYEVSFMSARFAKNNLDPGLLR